MKTKTTKTAKLGRKSIGAENLRVPYSLSLARITVNTIETLVATRNRSYPGCNPGRMVDDIVSHSVATHFNPIHNHT